MGFFQDFRESLENPFLNRKSDQLLSLQSLNIETGLSTNQYSDQNILGYFDDGIYSLYSQGNNTYDIAGIVTKQNELIEKYRKVASNPDVEAAISEIVNDMSFNYMNNDIVSLVFDDTGISDSSKEALIDVFESVKQVLDLDKNIETMCRRFYIDGQLNIALSYYDSKDQINQGIQRAYIMSPLNLMYDKQNKKWVYNSLAGATTGKTFNSIGDNEEYSDEEFVRIDSGMYHNGLILSDLQNIIKTVNQLETLEDLLIPLRYSRSVSRRVFNIDVGNLPFQKGVQAVENMKDKFKYRKFYDVETGRISNQSSVQSIVEDYFFAARNGERGCKIDVLDETGNLGETGDIDYFKDKLNGSLKVPLSRLSKENNKVFDFDSSSTDAAEVKFFAFIQSKRKKFNDLFIEIFRRQCVSKGILTDDEFELYKRHFKIVWSNESIFLEKQKQNILKERLALYSEYKEYEGDLFSRDWLLKNILKLTDDEIMTMQEQIVEEGSGEEEDELPNDDLDVDEFGDVEDTEENQEKLEDPTYKVAKKASIKNKAEPKKASKAEMNPLGNPKIAKKAGNEPEVSFTPKVSKKANFDGHLDYLDDRDYRKKSVIKKPKKASKADKVEK